MEQRKSKSAVGDEVRLVRRGDQGAQCWAASTAGLEAESEKPWEKA